MQSVAVVRDKARVDPKIGEPFEFTEEEIEHIEAVNPDALSDKITVSAQDVDAGKASVKVAGKKAAKSAENKGEDI
jgi:hypothetical protein